MQKFGVPGFRLQPDQGSHPHNLFRSTEADGVAPGTQPVLSDQFFPLSSFGQPEVSLPPVEPDQGRQPGPSMDLVHTSETGSLRK